MTRPPTRRSTCRDFYCGALTRKKHRCKRYKLKGRKRCRLHAGLSTGPRTEEGKARVSASVAAAWVEWRKQIGLPPEWRSKANQVCHQKRERLGLMAAAYVERHGPHRPEEPTS